MPVYVMAQCYFVWIQFWQCKLCKIEIRNKQTNWNLYLICRNGACTWTSGNTPRSNQQMMEGWGRCFSPWSLYHPYLKINEQKLQGTMIVITSRGKRVLACEPRVGGWGWQWKTHNDHDICSTYHINKWDVIRERDLSLNLERLKILFWALPDPLCSVMNEICLNQM